MKPLQSDCVKIVIPPVTATVATNATSTGYLDTLDFDYAKIIVSAAATHATTSAVFSVLALSEGTNSAAATAIPAFTGDATATSTSAGFVLAVADDTTAGAAAVLNVDLTKRQRYLKLVATPKVADSIAAVAILTRGKKMPNLTNDNAVNVVTG